MEKNKKEKRKTEMINILIIEVWGIEISKGDSQHMLPGWKGRFDPLSKATRSTS